MQIKVGSAPAAWGVNFASDPKQTPWSRYLDEVSEAGYHWTELGPYGYLPTDWKTLRDELDNRQLKLSGGFVMRPLEDPQEWPKIERDILGIGQLLTNLGASHLLVIDAQYTDGVTGEIVNSISLNDEKWKILIETIHAVSRLAKDEFNLQTVFHPHTETHVQHEPEIVRFMQDTDPLVSICFDIGHHTLCGGNSLSFLRKHKQRIRYLHLKSIDPVKLKDVQERSVPLAIATAEGVFCEPSRGIVDFLALRELLGEISYDGFGIVEHDMYPAPFDKPLPIAKRTRTYLKKIGLG